MICPFPANLRDSTHRTPTHQAQSEKETEKESPRKMSQDGRQRDMPRCRMRAFLLVVPDVINGSLQKLSLSDIACVAASGLSATKDRSRRKLTFVTAMRHHGAVYSNRRLDFLLHNLLYPELEALSLTRTSSCTHTSSTILMLDNNIK